MQDNRMCIVTCVSACTQKRERPTTICREHTNMLFVVFLVDESAILIFFFILYYLFQILYNKQGFLLAYGKEILLTLDLTALHFQMKVPCSTPNI